MYSVRAENSDNTEKVETEEGIFSHMSKHLSERFRLAFTSKYYSGKFFDDVGFIGDTEAAREILEGTYDYPPDMDPATWLLFEEAAHTYAKMHTQKSGHICDR